MFYNLPSKFWIENDSFLRNIYVQNLYFVHVWNRYYLLLNVFICCKNFLKAETRYWSHAVFSTGVKKHQVWILFHGYSIQIRNSFRGIYTNFDYNVVVGRYEKNPKNKFHIIIFEIIVWADNGLDCILFDFQYDHDVYCTEYMGHANIWLLNLHWFTTFCINDLLGQSRPLRAFENKSLCFLYFFVDLLVSGNIYVAVGL